MVQIQKPKEYIIGMLGKQIQNNNFKYRFLYYCLSVPFEDKILLFNNLTKELLALSLNEFKDLERNNFNKNNTLFNELVEKWFLVPDDTDDLTICEQLRQLAALIEQSDNDITLYNILPTTACNARCFYCFEEGAQLLTMDNKTADDVAKFIINKSNNKRVQICWFGGEPLCNYAAINRISDKLSKSGINFFSMMTTNGYLFDETVVTYAKNLWNLLKVNITLDGMPETYCKVKNYKNNDPNAFEKVLNNVELLCKKNINISIRLNIDKHNYSELHSLVELLSNRFRPYINDLIEIKPVALYEGDEFNITSRPSEERKKLLEELIKIKKFISEKGFKDISIDINRFATYACLADNKNSVLILPDGHLGFCEHNVSSDFYGSIYDNVKKPFWSNYRKTTDDCKMCPYLPSCRQLEKCAPAGKECFEYKKYLRIESLINGVKKVYIQYLKRNTGDGSMC